MKEIIAYQCEYCRRQDLNKSLIEHHENKCYANPRAKHCFNCEHDPENNNGKPCPYRNVGKDPYPKLNCIYFINMNNLDEV